MDYNSEAYKRNNLPPIKCGVCFESISVNRFDYRRAINGHYYHYTCLDILAMRRTFYSLNDLNYAPSVSDLFK